MALGRRALLVSLALSSATCTSGGGGAGDSCVSNKDCGSNAICVSGGCVAKLAKGCTSDDACPLGQSCEIESHTCVPTMVGPAPSGCTVDAECPSYQRCNETTGACINGRRSCLDETPCTAIGQHCDTARMQCVQCAADAQCTSPQKCLDGECVDPTISSSCVDDKGCAPPSTICEASVCVRGCTSPTGLSCTGGNTCNDQTGRCDATTPTGCTTDSACGAPAGVCENGQCIGGCAQIGGLACTGGDVCDSNTGRCVTILGPCTTDPDCNPPDNVCELGQCIPGCARPGGVQCSGAEECNTNSGRCVPRTGPICASDLDCQAPSTICNLFNGACDPGCGTTGCTAPETCDGTTGHCVGTRTCVPDGFEDNDTRPAARPLTSSQLNLTACAADDDFYSLSLAANDTLSVQATFAIGEGNIDLELYDPNGTVVASGRTTASNEMLSYEPSVAGNYVLRAFLVTDSGPTPGNTYSLMLNLTPAPCGMDAYEENDSDSNPAPINPGSYSGLNTCAMDEDWYEVDLSSGDEITVTVSFDSNEGDIDIQLVNLIGFTVASSGGTGSSESFTFTANLSAPYMIRVYLFADRGSMLGTPYTMNVSLGSSPPPPPPPSCTDALEENDSSAAAVALTPGTRNSLSVCTGDDDYYRITLGNGDRLTVSTSFTNSDGDIDLQLANPAGSNVASSASTSNAESINYTATAAGDYVLRVFLYADAGSNPGNGYSLDVAVAGPACPPDQFEPNESAAAAAALSPGSYSGLTACATTENDYYALSLTAGDALVVDLGFSNAEGDLDTTLLNAAGTVVASSAGIVDGEHIAYTVPTTDTYHLRVYMYRDQGSTLGNTYSLTVTR